MFSYGAPNVEAPVAAGASANADDDPAAAPNSRHCAWAALMRRAFDIDVLAYPRCGGRTRVRRGLFARAWNRSRIPVKWFLAPPERP